LLPSSEVSNTERRAALVRSLLRRHGVLVRDALKAEGVQGGFSAVYEVLKAMEDAGRVRRGYFVEHLGAAQFVEPGLEEPLRAQRDYRERDEDGPRMLASIDPASPWGAALAWPATSSGRRPMRATGANVLLSGDGQPLAWLGRSEHTLLTFSPPEGADRAALAAQIARGLADSVERGGRRAMLLAQVDGEETQRTWLAPALEAAGFTSTLRGFFKRGRPRTHPRMAEPDAESPEDDELS
jgi:ATP-dependent Lhr-like helicase